MAACMAELDFDFVAVDAQASETYPLRAGELKKGSYAMLKAHPCKLVEYTTSKTGKHGHAKAHMVGIDIFTGRKYEEACPTSHSLEAPVVTRSEYQVVSLGSSGAVSVLLETGVLKSDLNLPAAAKHGEPTEEDARVQADIEQAYEEGEMDVFVVVVRACSQEKIVGLKLVK